jgi:hypothetical protein
VLFQKEKNILIVTSGGFCNAKFIIRQIISNLKLLPKSHIFPEIVEQSPTHIKFNNGSEITASHSTPKIINNNLFSLCIFDEVEHIDHVQDLLIGIKPSILTGGSVILISTPGNFGSLFHTIWTESKKNKNDFCPIVLYWFFHPGRNLKWFVEQKQMLMKFNNSQKAINNELLCRFF